MAGKKQTIGLILMLCISLGLYAQQKKTVQVMEIPSGFCIHETEWRLYTMINEYRRQYDLPPVPLSKSLCWVATTHLKDLFFNHPDEGNCNSHSWSDKGPWKPICYPGEESKQLSVWDKPKEISGYPGKGFEIVYWENGPVNIDSVIRFWRSFDYFNGFLMNTGKWEGKAWHAIGIGILENYACAWFGEVADPEGFPLICGQKALENSPGSGKDGQKPANNPPSPSIAGRYYIIVKSGLSNTSALEEVKKLSSKGYTEARVISEDNKIRVSIFDTSDRNEALRKLREIKTIYSDAWLFQR